MDRHYTYDATRKIQKPVIMNRVVLIAITFAMLGSLGHALDDPRNYTLCLFVEDGKAQVIKNTTGKEWDDMIKKINPDMREGSMILFRGDDDHFTIRTLATKDGMMGYKLDILGEQELFYRLKVEEFIKYVKEESEWEAIPMYQHDRKTKVAHQLVPREIK